MPPRDRLGAVDAMPVEAGEVSLNGWIKIGADGTVMLAMNRSEMGQGTHTALAMLVAEELDVTLVRVRLVPAGADRLYGNVATLVASLPYFHPRETEPGHETTRRIGCHRHGRLRAVTGKTGRHRSIGDGGEPEQVPVYDLLPIDRERRGATRAKVVERRPARIEDEPIRKDQRVLPNGELVVAAHERGMLGTDPREVELTGDQGR